MSETNPDSPKLFTLQEANALLPLVRVITRDIVQLSSSIIHTRQRIISLKNRHGGDRDDVYLEEVAAIERGLSEDTRRLQEYVDELVELGVEPKGLDQGLVDFLAVRAGEVVCLCWKYDEAEIQFWHRIEDGFQGRKPIDHFFADSNPSGETQCAQEN